MDFAISNFLIDTFQTLDNYLFYKGNYEKKEGLYSFIDGCVIEDVDILDIYKNKNKVEALNGMFTFVIYNSESKDVVIRNDSMGKMPLFYYCKNGKFIISNNVWTIVQNIGAEDVFNLDVLKSLFFFITIPNETDTYFKDVFRFPNGSLGHIEKGANINIERYYEYKHEPDHTLRIEDEAEKLDAEFVKYFKFLKEKHKGNIMGFGNSGGFDSRLIAYYANKVELPSVAYVIGQKKPNRLLKSTTTYLAEKIANHFQIENRWIEYSTRNMLEYMLLDVRNNPFHTTQLFKNPINEVGFFDYEVTGQPGSIPKGIPKSIVEGTRSDLIEFSKRMYGFALETLKGSKNNKRRAAKHLGFDYSFTYSDSYLSELFSEEEFLSQSKKFDDFYDDFKEYSQFNAWENFNERIVIKYDIAGGYESFSRTKPTFYLYYPFFYLRSKKWPEKFLYDRKILQVMFKQLSSFLSETPGQDFQPAKDVSVIVKYFKKFEMAIRGRGLNFDFLLKDKKYQSFTKEILERPNPIFESIVDPKKVLKSKIMNTVCGMNIVKLKMITDVVYYKEFSKLENPKHEIVSRL